MFYVLFVIVETGMEMIDFGKFNAIFESESESEMFIRSVDPGTPAKSISGCCRRRPSK